MKYFLLLIFGLILVYSVLLRHVGNSWEITACNVGQGDAYLISKGSFQFLIDLGPSLSRLLICLQAKMPMFDKEIEAILVTHADYDHYGGIIGLEEYYNIDNIYHNADVGKVDDRYGEFLEY